MSDKYVIYCPMRGFLPEPLHRLYHYIGKRKGHDKTFRKLLRKFRLPCTITEPEFEAQRDRLREEYSSSGAFVGAPEAVQEYMLDVTAIAVICTRDAATGTKVTLDNEVISEQ